MLKTFQVGMLGTYCDKLTNQSVYDPLERYSALNKFIFSRFDIDCQTNFNDTANFYSDRSWDSPYSSAGS